MLRIFAICLCLLGVHGTAWAQNSDLQTILQDNQSAVERASRTTISPVLDALIESGLPQVPVFLEKWRARELWMRESDGLFFFTRENGDLLDLLDVSTGEVVGQAPKGDMKQLRPNSGVQSVMAAALVQFQLSDPDESRRVAGLSAIERSPETSHLGALRASIEDEPVAVIKERKMRLERLLTIRFDDDPAARIAAMESFRGDLSVDVRAALNPILSTRQRAAVDVPDNINLARIVVPGRHIDRADAYQVLVDRDLALPRIPDSQRNDALVAAIVDGKIGAFAVADMNTEDARNAAYAALAAQSDLPPFITEDQIAAALADNVIFDVYDEPNGAITDAARATLNSINRGVGINQMLDLSLDGLSLASIYFLAAIGLAITFGVMGVINMAHGEFIMIGAYTGYVVQLFIPNYTASILVALPLAFALAFIAGVAMERLVIRHLMSRPQETLLATFGISIALQQLAKNIFGTQARPLTSPAWLDGAWVLNDVVSISYIRIAIFVMALGFLALLLFILNRTRLGLEVRAVTQNPRMASSMGINPDRINMLTFGLGSGIAGIAGVAIGLFAQVTSELGSAYIVQSFMTVVVGGVGNIWGTLAGAGMIGILQKAIEWLNPSNTLAAQTYMIIFIIIFIQFRPKGIVALKGRAAGD